MKKLLLLLALTGCPPTPPAPPPSPPDASDAAPSPPVADSAPPTPPAVDAAPSKCSWATACDSLKKAGCSLGAATDCGDFMIRDIGSGKVANKVTGKPMTCDDIAAVKSKAAAQALGFACQ